MQNSRCPLGKVSHKGTVSGNKSICGSASTIPPLSTAASKCHSCGNMRCQCSLQNDFAHASFMDLTLERSVGQDHGAFTMGSEYPSHSEPDPGNKNQVSWIWEFNDENYPIDGTDEVEEDVVQGIVGVVPIPSDDAGKEEVISALVSNVEAMIRADRKTTALF